MILNKNVIYRIFFLFTLSILCIKSEVQCAKIVPDNFWFIEENSGAGNIALANAALAGFTPGEGFLVNPATIKLLNQYSVSGQKSLDDYSYLVNVQDSKTSAVGGALSVKRLSPLYDVATLEDSIKLGLAFGGGQLTVGVMGKRNWIKGEASPFINADVGVLLDLSSVVKFGATFQNILDSNYAYQRGKILAIGTGIYFSQLIEFFLAYKKVLQSSTTNWSTWTSLVADSSAAWVLQQNQNNSESYHAAAKLNMGGFSLSAGGILLPNQNSFWTSGARYQSGNIGIQYTLFGVLTSPQKNEIAAPNTSPIHEISILLNF